MRIVNTLTLGSIMLLLASGAILGVVGWHRYSVQIQAARNAPPLNLTVDLSQGGVYRGTIDNPAAFAHGQLLQLKLGPTTRPDLFSGLEATVRIEDEKQQNLLDRRVTTEDLAISPEAVVVLHMPSLPVGKHHLTLEV